jgi:predicted nucleic acid-binding protein
LNDLDLGEREAIALAEYLDADLLFLDDRAARQLAVERNIAIIGVLDILGTAAKRGLINFPEAIAQLQQTTFRASPTLIQALLKTFQDEP